MHSFHRSAVVAALRDKIDRLETLRSADMTAINQLLPDAADQLLLAVQVLSAEPRLSVINEQGKALFERAASTTTTIRQLELMRLYYESINVEMLELSQSDYAFIYV